DPARLRQARLIGRLGNDAVEHVCKPAGERGALDDEPDLRVQPRRARIEIERADEDALAIGGEGLRVKARRAAAERAAPLPALPFVDESRLPRTMWPTATCSARHRAARLGLLSELRRPADGRDGRVARGRCPAAPAGP